MAASDDEISAYAFRVWGYKQGELVALMIHLGDRLGLFRTLAGMGPVTADEVAEATGLDRRWLLEWLRGTAAAGLLESPDGTTFTLPEAAEAVLCQDEHLAFAAGAFGGGRTEGYVDRLADAFRTGIGPDYDAQGERGAHEIERLSAPWTRAALVPVVLPRLAGVVDALEAGGRVLDLGCGGGMAVEAIARAFPNAKVEGVDLSEHAVARAAERVAGLPNATIRHGRAEEAADTAAYDLVITLDCLHDMTRPEGAAAAVRQAMKPDGAWLVKEIRCWPTWDQNKANPMLAMFFGFSLTACLASATSEPGGAGLGTVGLHGERLQELVSAAGFSSCIVHDAGDPANLYYEVRI